MILLLVKYECTHIQQQPHALAIILVKQGYRTMQDQEYQAITITCPTTPPPMRTTIADSHTKKNRKSQEQTTEPKYKQKARSNTTSSVS